MALKREDVAKIAHLARLELGPEELDLYGKQLEAILGYVEKLNELDLKDVEPTTHVLPLTDRKRDDRVEPGLTPDDLAANAPEFRLGMVRVPRIMEDS
jgi:aspartyl-tRNA(Asn)/glutamyl-tRNA(Gln) amidotransferase subunit C